MIRVIVSPRARIDMREINAYIGGRGGRATAERFVDKIETAIAGLGIFPQSHSAQPHLGADIRLLMVNPYLVFYRVTDETVTVLRVLHGARNITKKLIK
jgi:toxin ParE1/3/4